MKCLSYSLSLSRALSLALCVWSVSASEPTMAVNFLEHLSAVRGGLHISVLLLSVASFLTGLLLVPEILNGNAYTRPVRIQWL